MSKGSRFVGFRLPPDLMAQVEARIATRNEAEAAGKVRNAEGQWGLSEYVRYCIEQDIKHAIRSRGGKPLVAPAAEEPQPQPVAQELAELEAAIGPLDIIESIEIGHE